MNIVESFEQRICLHSETELPLAAGYLWNSTMMLKINCQGYANAQFMQPEPASYATGPALEATTFMQPEQSVYAHHPGRFFYIKDNQNSELFSLPFAPVKSHFDSYEFIVEGRFVRWNIEQSGLKFALSVELDTSTEAEIWELRVENLSARERSIEIYPYFPIGYRSWMNQSANFNDELIAIISKKVTPYQKVDDYFKQKNFKDITFFVAKDKPTSWEANQQQFEGETGLHNPSGVLKKRLDRGDALYETPCAAMQYSLDLAPEDTTSLRFAFGAAHTVNDIKALRERVLNCVERRLYEDEGNGDRSGCSSLIQDTPDHWMNNFVNFWLPRQIRYHNEMHRLSTDPQTRNFLQDGMGLSYLDAESAKQNLMLALSQQNSDGSMPDGILLHPEAELKYINQIPHTDHAVWLIITVHNYLRETNDLGFLNDRIKGAGSQSTELSVFDRVCAALEFLARARDERGLCYIDQGDWCDPMNMVGYKGRGVSTWLTLATAYASTLWAEVCDKHDHHANHLRFLTFAKDCNDAVNEHCWNKNWYARGITDDGQAFGIADDEEGKIYLNPQSWALLADTPAPEQVLRLLASVKEQLHGPWGVEMLAPAYTSMREDVGRLTQKFPGTAENGSVYNHASAFYAFALYRMGKSDLAFEVLQKMLPTNDLDDLLRRGQLPNFIPNYYRGANKQFSRTAGRSSQLFHTGTIHWYLRCVIEGLFGLQADFGRLRICPQIPAVWPSASVHRWFLGARFEVNIKRSQSVKTMSVTVDGTLLSDPIISNIEPGKRYLVEVALPSNHVPESGHLNA